MSLNSCIFDAIGAPGSLNTRMLRYFNDNGASSQVFNIAERQFLAAQGAATSDSNTMWVEFLNGQGYSGSLNSMLYKFWCEDGGVLESVAWEALAAGAGNELFLQTTGTGLPSMSRTAEVYARDYQGIYRAFKTNIPVYEGARHDLDGAGKVIKSYATGDSGEALDYWGVAQPAVTNRVPYSFDLTQWTIRGTATVVNDFTFNDGRIGSRVTVGSQNNDVFVSPGGGIAGNPIANKLWIVPVSTSGTLEVIHPSTPADGHVTLDFAGLTPGEMIEVFELATVVAPFISNAGDTGMLLYTNSGSIEMGVYNSHVEGVGDINKRNNIAPIFTDGAALSTDGFHTKWDVLNHVDAMGAYYVEYKPTYAYDQLPSDDQTVFGMADNNGILNARQSALTGNFGANDSGYNRSTYRLQHAADEFIALAVVYDTASNKMQINVNGAYGNEVVYSGAFLNFDNVLEVFAPLGFAGRHRNLQRTTADTYEELKTWIDNKMLEAFTLTDDAGTVLTDDAGEILVSDDYQGSTV